MLILDYLVVISIIVISVVKTADLFILSDHALSKRQKLFIEKTRSYHKSMQKNKQGNISLVSAILMVILSAFFLFSLTKMKLEFNEALYRKESYLCFHFLNVETAKYIKEMAYFNWSLRAAFLAKNTIVNGVSGESIFQSLKSLRNARHLLYLQKMAINSFCHLPETLSYYRNIPFQTQASGVLATRPDETTIPRQNKWTLFYYKRPRAIRLTKSFCLKSELSIQNAFTPDLQEQTSEVGFKDLLFLKCSFGPSS
ncbi:MAG: hypothetical protein KBD76_04330 [Bacteriovorax sp.]|nr:hypothetical protein [Bacteriovorax sp.]